MIWDQIKSCWWDQVVILTFLIWALNYRGTPDAVLSNVTMLHEDNNAGANNVKKNVLAAGEQMRRTWEEQ